MFRQLQGVIGSGAPREAIRTSPLLIDRVLLPLGDVPADAPESDVAIGIVVPWACQRTIATTSNKNHFRKVVVDCFLIHKHTNKTMLGTIAFFIVVDTNTNNNVFRQSVCK